MKMAWFDALWNTVLKLLCLQGHCRMPPKYATDSGNKMMCAVISVTARFLYDIHLSVLQPLAVQAASVNNRYNARHCSTSCLRQQLPWVTRHPDSAVAIRDAVFVQFAKRLNKTVKRLVA